MNVFLIFFEVVGPSRKGISHFFFETEFKVSPRRFRQEIPDWLQTFVKNKSQKFTFYRPYSETRISNTYLVECRVFFQEVPTPKILF